MIALTAGENLARNMECRCISETSAGTASQVHASIMQTNWLAANNYHWSYKKKNFMVIVVTVIKTYVTPYKTGMMTFLLTLKAMLALNKNIKVSFFKSSETIRKK